jgi:thiol-disulfide isomerase/thioredoxin
MNKKIAKCLIFACIIAVIALLGIYIHSKVKQKEIAKENYKTLKEFCATTSSGREFCTKELPQHPVLLIFFHTECEICQEEISQLVANADKFKDISILMITYAGPEHVNKFYMDKKLDALSDLHIFLDNKMELMSRFDINIIPSVFLYNEKRELICKINGEVKMETLLKYFQSQK